jgi:hypothetical protein
MKRLTLTAICILLLFALAGAAPNKRPCMEMGRPVKCQPAPHPHPRPKPTPKPLDCPGWPVAPEGCGRP